MTSITIPENVTSIGASAFSGCSGLESIIIPFVGTSASATGSSQLFGHIFGMASYTGGTATVQYYNYSSYSIYYIPSSLKTVVITGGVYISGYAFYGCSNLATITILDGATFIGTYAFYGCYSLTSITIPNSVTSISTCAFGCKSLASIEFLDDSTWYCTKSSDEWRNKSGGTAVDVSDAVMNVNIFYNTYYWHYWYKLEE